MSQKKNRKKLSKRYFLIILGEILIGVGVLIFAYQTIFAPIRNMEVKNPMTHFLLIPENQEVEETAAPDVVVFEQADHVFQPFCTENTNPANMIAETAIEVDGNMMADETSLALIHLSPVRRSYDGSSRS